MNAFTIDPEFKSLIPPLSEDEFARLEKSIIAEGVRDPIITWNGVIVDGHNRYNITQAHGLECPNREREFANRDAAKIWIIENQFGRRNLNMYNRSVLALQLEPLYAAEAKRRMLAGKANPVQNSSQGTDTGKTREKVAKAAGVSHDTISKVKKIETEAANGNPVAIQVKAELESGGKSINGAYNIVTGKKKQRTVEESTTDDGRRICGICGKVINPGESYDYEPTFHKKCRSSQHVIAQRKYRDADHALRANVPVYSVESILRELTASAENLREAWEQTIEFNESMGAKLVSENKAQLLDAVSNLFRALQSVKESENNV